MKSEPTPAKSFIRLAQGPPTFTTTGLSICSPSFNSTPQTRPSAVKTSVISFLNLNSTPKRIAALAKLTVASNGSLMYPPSGVYIASIESVESSQNSSSSIFFGGQYIPVSMPGTISCMRLPSTTSCLMPTSVNNL